MELVTAILLLISLIFYYFFIKKRNESYELYPNRGDEFGQEQHLLDEFNRKHNFLEEGGQLARNYFKLLHRRYGSGRVNKNEINNQISQSLIPHYEEIISNYKIGNLEDKAFEKYLIECREMLSKYKNQLELFAYLLVIVFELYGKLGLDAEKLGKQNLKKHIDKQFEKLKSL